MVFNRGNKLCKVNLWVNGRKIENVKSFKYLGFTIGTKNCSFNATTHDLSIKAKRAIFALSSKIKLSQMPINLALKIFNSQVLPILLYGAEVWGPYMFSGTDKWEKSETEMVHTQFLKRVLGCDIHTSNVMTRTELGRMPLFCDIIRKSVMYIKNIKFNPESLAYQALEYEEEHQDQINILQLVKNLHLTTK